MFQCCFKICRSHSQSSRKSYYKVLSIHPDATQEEIKTAFYQKSKELHPDSHKSPSGDSTEFQELCVAYEALKNTKTRLEHDNLLGLHQHSNNHIGRYYADQDTPKSWTYAHEDPGETIPIKEKVSLMLSLIGACTVAIFIIQFELKRRRKISYQKRTDIYAEIPPILRPNSTKEKTANLNFGSTRTATDAARSKDSLDKLRTWK